MQGIGAAGLTSIPVVVLGDVAAPKERGKYSAYFAVTYTTAGACGPALGGFLSDYLHWSAIFWLNIPLDLAALLVTSTLLRRLPRYERPHRLDLIGAILVVAASVSFMLGLNLAGVRYEWTSAPIVALFGTSVAGRRPVRVAAAHGARAADPDRNPQASDRALRDHRQCLRMERHRRAQHLPADLSAERRRTVGRPTRA